ncbi:hypothetical protein 7S11_7 [uncultured Caudovirales phage]|uniref:Scaffolding protein n=1 Tax=uncultured Caudovirales phage TaxID=2100421 RepID=A0A2H4IYC3_9CAUD|nr:hypothetical protein 7S11_7 [uncultured Caudovirales phage]
MSDTLGVTETETQATEQQPTELRLPEDHSLVKTLAAQKETIKELKAKAGRLDEIENVQRTDAEKAAERISQAEAEVAAVPSKVADALRSHLIALHGIEPERAELFLTATEPELLLKQVTALVGESDKRKKNHVPREGTSIPAPNDDMRGFARKLFGGE